MSGNNPSCQIIPPEVLTIHYSYPHIPQPLPILTPNPIYGIHPLEYLVTFYMVLFDDQNRGSNHEWQTK